MSKNQNSPKLTDDVIVMDRGNYTTCTVHLYGGTVMSYRVENREMLYMKRKTAFNQFSAIRGGVKFTFPYFGTRINGPKHGFSRYVRWNMVKAPVTRDDGNVEAFFGLEDTEYTRAIWNYKFKIMCKLTLCMKTLRIDMQLKNTCKFFPCFFTVLRYGIFKVKDLRNCEIYGLANRNYMEIYSSEPTKLHPNPYPINLKIERSYMDLFIDTPDIVELRNIDNHGQTLRLTSSNSTSNNVLIYNPWEENPEQVSQSDSHDEQEYLRFVGIGQGHISSVVRLEPQQIWESYHIIEVVDEENGRRINELAKLLDDPLKLFNETCL